MDGAEAIELPLLLNRLSLHTSNHTPLKRTMREAADSRFTHSIDCDLVIANASLM